MGIGIAVRIMISLLNIYSAAQHVWLVALLALSTLTNRSKTNTW